MFSNFKSLFSNFKLCSTEYSRYYVLLTCCFSDCDEVLDEGVLPRPGRKRKRQDPRSHKDDEKDRRKAIATEFEELKLYLPEEKRCKARQELLGNIRDLVWVSRLR